MVDHAVVGTRTGRAPSRTAERYDGVPIEREVLEAFGGNDILFHASRYMSRTLSAERYTAPAVVERLMAEGRNGLKDGKGFYDYRDTDVPAYRQDVLRRTLGQLRHAGLFKPPVID